MASQVNTDKIASSSGVVAFTIPTADGTANQHLKTDGSGVLGWATPPTGIALTGSTNTWIPTITGADALTGTANFTYDGNTLDIKNSGTASSIKLYCESSNAHAQEIKAAPHAGSSAWTLTLPPTVPSVSGQALTATTAGVSTWATVSTYGTYSASIRKNANQSIPNNTSPVCTFEVTDFDSSPSTNMADLTNNRVYFRAEGTYLVISNTKWGNGAANGARYTFIKYYDSSAPAALYLGNAYGFPYMSPTGTGTQFWSVVVPVIIDAGAVGDFVSCECNQNCGQAVDVSGDSDFPIDGAITNLTVMRIE